MGVGSRRCWSQDPMPFSRSPSISTTTYHQRRHVRWEDSAPPCLFFLVSQVPATLSLSLSFKAMSQSLASSPSLGAHQSAIPLTPFLQGPSRKACGCPQSPGARDPLIGHPQPWPPQALRSSFAWPWSCPRGNRRSGSGEGSRRRKTYSGSCGSRSQSTEH